MKTLKYLRLILGLIMILTSFAVAAHQPILNSEIENSEKSPYLIDEPEISKAIYAELTGLPHYYRISSEKDFKFYAGITAPKIEGCLLQKKFSYEVLDEEFKLIERKDGESFKWWSWYEKHGEKWYWIGPEIGKDFKSNQVYEKGTYYLRIYNKSNTGQYVLAVGDIESFPITVIARMLFTLPKINSSFWDDVECPRKKV